MPVSRQAWNSGLTRVVAGELQGAATPDGVVKSFRGVPFAAPPVGALRWRPPQRVAPWGGVRPATTNAPCCTQVPRPRGSISDFGVEPASEDCLYLNVWSAARDPGERRPVMVWIHGGGFYYGSGTLPQFDGASLARRGVVVVTINYRLGPLGFLAHPDLVAESAHRSAGNYGFLDQIAALDWVRENIAAFGGDPGRVTIFGQSVGSSSVCCLVASPLTRGLIHGAICQSGGSMAPEEAPGGGSMQTLAGALEQGLAFAARHGAKSIAELREKPAEALQLPPPGTSGAALAREMFCTRLSGWVIVDGYAIPDKAHSIYAAGRQNHVPLMTGANSHEGSAQPAAASLEALEADCRNRFGDEIARAFLSFYRVREAADPLETARIAMGERGFNWQNDTQLRLHARTAGDAAAFGYYFCRRQPFPEGATYVENTTENLGAFHTAEIPFVFDNLATRDWSWTQADRDFAHTMASYWVNFASNGDPNGAGLPLWPRYEATRDEIMVFGDRAEAAVNPMRARLSYWDEHFAALRERLADAARAT